MGNVLNKINMQTIIGLLNFIAALCAAAFNFYFFLSHGDMDKGIMEPMDLTTQMSDYLPAEFACHLFVTISSFINGNYLIFLYCVPLAFYHGVQYQNKTYKVYAVTREEYKPTKKQKMKC